VRAAYQIHVVFLQETRDHIRTKSERYTTVVLAPASDVLVGIGPQKIAEQAAVGDIRGAHDPANLLHRIEIGAQTAVHGEDLLVDDSGDGKAVEAVGEGLPQLDVVAALALVVESVDAVDGRALVVAPQDEEVLGILDLVRQEQADGLQGLLATVDVVSQEEVIRFWWEAAVFEQAQKVVVLAVNVTADLEVSCQLIPG